MGRPVLYSFRRCPYAMRARLSLVSTSQNVELREVVLRDKPTEMLEASPKATVPILVLADGTVLDESLDVMHWAVAQGDGEGLRDFRARLIEDGQARPVFGQARKVCNSAPDLAECWEIATLRVDGKRRLPSLDDTNTSEPPRATPRQNEQPEKNEIETGDVPVGSSADKVDPPAPKSPKATHLVARPIINVRGGPGLDNPVLFKLPQGARLGLLSHERGWGKFIILDGESQGAEAWASLSILEALR